LAASTTILLVRRFFVPRFLPPIFGEPLGLASPHPFPEIWDPLARIFNA
jgi:hypothetical protein